MPDEAKKIDPADIRAAADVFNAMRDYERSGFGDDQAAAFVAAIRAAALPPAAPTA